MSKLERISVFPPAEARAQGGGTAVMAPPAPASVPLAAWTRTVKPSTISEMLKVMSRPGLISFALGLPSPEMFPVDEYAAAARRALEDRSSLQYRPPYAALKRQIVELMAGRGVRCREEQIFLTTAAQQGLSLLARIFMDPGAQVICDRLVYTGFQQVLEPFQPEILAVDTDLETGMDVDQVEALLEDGARPAFIYVITDGHNPLAVSVSPEKRLRLVELARRFGVPLVEDDAYGLLHFGRPVLPMRALDDRWVFYVGSFSKVMAPGFRLGWVVAPEELVPLLGCAKDASDIDTSNFSQRLVHAYMDSGHFATHLPVVRDAYRLRRDTMLRALEQNFGGTGARWVTPTNGALIWLELPPHVDTTALLKVSVEEEGVAYVPGNAFAVDGSEAGRSGMRLNFSHPSPREIEEGIARMARAVRRTFG
jgi:2-aminoadipate transaminase